ncbi:MAG TPA: response regulator transcription factor [Chitinophagaceae bacterium]|jgi:DNA-binding NarL/FixJ family response regulator|nr:response regulator transcription factor [Chitinophagaceae bacterium]
MPELSQKIRLLIADDHRVLLDGLVSLLKTEPNFEVSATAHDGQQVIELLSQAAYDICLLDISMPVFDGIETARQVIKKYPSTKVIILTTHDEEQIIAEMLYIGVSGYLLKSSTRQELVEAINRVMKGKLYFSETVNETMLRSYANELERKKRPEEKVMLTQREKEIIQLLAREYTNERIANALHISYRTVETHRKNIMQKTKAHNLAGLIRFAYSKGLIQE